MAGIARVLLALMLTSCSDVAGAECQDIVTTQYAFAIRKSDGTVVTWGDSSMGGDSSAVQSQLTSVEVIYANLQAFAAKRSDGTVVTWGDP